MNWEQIAEACGFLSTLSLRRATMWTVPGPPLFLIFLSTLSLRRATVPPFLKFPSVGDFYPRSPCGERRRHSFSSCIPNISIHALLAESDGRHSVYYQAMQGFLSTLSLRRATTTADKEARKRLISIHALLAESDAPPAPQDESSKKFLSTLSLRRATSSSLKSFTEHLDFYPRSPCGERR